MEQIILNNKNGSTEIYYKLFSMLSLLTFHKITSIEKKKKNLKLSLENELKNLTKIILINYNTFPQRLNSIKDFIKPI